jgi:DNA-binding response OmpR family regulator
MRRIWPMLVLLCGSNPVLSDLVSRQLVRRGFVVRAVPLGPLDASTVRPGEAFDMVVADLDVAEPELWQRAASLRATFPYVPLLLLAHAWPGAADLEQLHPCVYVRKPLAIDELSAALDDARLRPAQAAHGRLELSRALD